MRFLQWMSRRGSAQHESGSASFGISSVSIDALLKLRDEVEAALSRRAKELQDQLSS